RDVDEGFESFELAVDERPVRPGTGVTDVEVEAPRLGTDGPLSIRTRAAVRGDPVAALGGVALEVALLIAFVPAVLPDTIHQQSHVSSLLVRRCRFGPSASRWMTFGRLSRGAQDRVELNVPRHSCATGGRPRSPAGRLFLSEDRKSTRLNS